MWTSLQRAAGESPAPEQWEQIASPEIGKQAEAAPSSMVAASHVITPVSVTVHESKPHSPLMWVMSAGILFVVIAGLLLSHVFSIDLPATHPTATALSSGGSTPAASQTITTNRLFSCAAPSTCNRQGIRLTLNTIAIDQNQMTMLWSFTVELQDRANCIGVSLSEVRLEDSQGTSYDATNQEQSSDFNLTQGQQVQQRMQFLFVPPTGATYTLIVHLNFACGTVSDAFGNTYTVTPFSAFSS